MIELIDSNKLYDVLIDTDNQSIRLEIKSKDGENYNNYIDWKYLGFDEYDIGFQGLMIVCEFDVSVDISSIDDSKKDKAIKQSVKSFKKLYKKNKKNILEFIEDVL